MRMPIQGLQHKKESCKAEQKFWSIWGCRDEKPRSVSFLEGNHVVLCIFGCSEKCVHLSRMCKQKKISTASRRTYQNFGCSSTPVLSVNQCAFVSTTGCWELSLYRRPVMSTLVPSWSGLAPVCRKSPSLLIRRRVPRMVVKQPPGSVIHGDESILVESTRGRRSVVQSTIN